MTLPASGYLLLGADGGASGRSVNSEFGYGNDMASYQGVYYGRGGVEYRFPVSGNQISMGYTSATDPGFYSTYKITGGSQTISSSQSFTIPVYNTISITAVGAAGGATGQPGYIQSPCNGAGSATPAQSGSPGGGSSFGGYVSAGGGGSDQGGYSSSVSYTNPIQSGGGGPVSGTSVYVTVGTGGNGGQGGCFTYQINPFGCSCWGHYNSGGQGSNGYVTVSWS